MPVTVVERPESRTTTNGKTAEYLYTITGTADEAAALTNLASTAPASVGTLTRTDLRVEPLHVDSETAAECMWLGAAQYTAPEITPWSAPVTGQSRYSFDTSGGTEHRTQASEHISSTAPAGATAPDHQGAIGVGGGEVAGCDVISPTFNWSETHYLSDATVTSTYKGYLFSLTGKTNNATFKGMAIGECLFTGASGSQREGGDWEITFGFASKPNKTDVEIGDDITVAAVQGWHYLWVEYEDDDDLNSKTPVKKPIAAHVERVYDAGDFSLLAIGTT